MNDKFSITKRFSRSDHLRQNEIIGRYFTFLHHPYIFSEEFTGTEKIVILFRLNLSKHSHVLGNSIRRYKCY